MKCNDPPPEINLLALLGTAPEDSILGSILSFAGSRIRRLHIEQFSPAGTRQLVNNCPILEELVVGIKDGWVSSLGQSASVHLSAYPGSTPSLSILPPPEDFSYLPNEDTGNPVAQPLPFNHHPHFGSPSMEAPVWPWVYPSTIAMGHPSEASIPVPPKNPPKQTTVMSSVPSSVKKLVIFGTKRKLFPIDIKFPDTFDLINHEIDMDDRARSSSSQKGLGALRELIFVVDNAPEKHAAGQVDPLMFSHGAMEREWHVGCQRSGIDFRIVFSKVSYYSAFPKFVIFSRPDQLDGCCTEVFPYTGLRRVSVQGGRRT